MKIEQRIPRPQGITQLSQSYQKDKDPKKQEEYKKRIQRLMINHYVNNGLRINDKAIEIDTFASMLQLNTYELLRRVNKEFERIGTYFENGDGKTFARGLLLGALKRILETQSRIQSQAAMLSRNQGQAYVPFLSAEVNRALKNEIDSFKPLTDILKIMTDTGTNNILIQNTTNNTQTNQYITADQALKMIENKGVGSMLLDEDKRKGKEAELGQLPEVGAKHQDLTGIGIRHKPIDEGKEGIEDAEIVS
jgi:hypothetical protein